jgi:hypothetical protein
MRRIHWFTLAAACAALSPHAVAFPQASGPAPNPASVPLDPTPVPRVAIAAAASGTWFVEEDAGTGVSLSVEQHDDGTQSVRGIAYGYVDGKPRWFYLATERPVSQQAAFARVDVQEFVGGNPNGTAAAVGVARTGFNLTFDSCDRATLSGFLPTRMGLRPQDYQGQHYHLRRLVPDPRCAALAGGAS